MKRGGKREQEKGKGDEIEIERERERERETERERQRETQREKSGVGKHEHLRRTVPTSKCHKRYVDTAVGEISREASEPTRVAPGLSWFSQDMPFSPPPPASPASPPLPGHYFRFRRTNNISVNIYTSTAT